MFGDLRRLEEGVTLRADFCIVGAGAAGITLARELATTGREVLLIESGGLEAEAATLALNEGEIEGLPYPPLDSARLRFYGGTTNHWDGHCRPLDAIDFEPRPWIPHSGWPLRSEDLAPFYPRAQEICELGPYRYAPEAWKPALSGLIPFASGRIVNRLWQFGPPTRFGPRYRAELASRRNVRVLLNANVVDIEVDDAVRTVTGLRIRAHDGPAGLVLPRVVVLAAGGIENPRLLLASNRRVEVGLGNGHDLVGRFFMEHPHALTAFAVPTVDVGRFAPYYRGVAVATADGVAILRAKPGLSEAVQRAEQLPNACVDIGYGYDRSAGYLSLREAARLIERGHLSEDLMEEAVEMVGDLEGLTTGLFRQLVGQSVLWFGANAEQLPNPESRVLLGDTHDSLGMPRVRLSWRLTQQDKTAVRRCCRILGEELARLGIARMHLDAWLLAEEESWSGLGVRYHHMGTTRMSDEPATGVVDRDCRVHGIANLYVAGSSVFPTSGYANPTLTIVALAVRLAEHLKTVAR